MAQRTANYMVRGYRPEDEGSVLELLRTSLGETTLPSRTSIFWQWKHFSNPFGPSYVRVACNEADQIIGMRAFMRWDFRLGTLPIKAVRAEDTSTHPDYRRLGIFSTLTKRVVDDVQMDGVDLIFNTPNEYSLPGYLKLGWDYVATVHPLIKVLNYPGFALGMLRSKLGKPSPRPHLFSEFCRKEPYPVAALLERREALQRLIQQDQQAWDLPQEIRTQRSWDYLRWRYGEHPAIPYWAVFTEHRGHLEGCAIFRANTRYGLREIILCELLLAAPERGLAFRLLAQLRALVCADYLLAYFPQGSFHRQALEGWGFRTVPREGVHFTAKLLEPALPVDPLRLPNWGLSLGDLELF